MYHGVIKLCGYFRGLRGQSPVKRTRNTYDFLHTVISDIEMWNVHKTVQTDHFSDAGRVFFTAFQVTPAWQFEGFRDELCFLWF